MIDRESDLTVFLIIGASRGIGRAIALRAASRRYHVLLTYSEREADAASVADLIRGTGGEASIARADAGKEADLLALFEQADRIGPLAVLVYSGGLTGTPSRLAEAATDTLERVIQVNLVGAMVAAREAVKRMSTERGGTGGSIVFLSSRAAAYGSPGEHVWYAASKGAIDSLTIGLAREVAAAGIRVNAVAPGPIDTDMLTPDKRAAVHERSPLGRAGTPDEVAGAVLFLTSQDASYITGTVTAVSGGL